MVAISAVVNATLFIRVTVTAQLFWTSFAVWDLIHCTRTRNRVAVGSRRADLTFAALLAPVMCVTPEEGYGAALPPIDALDEPPSSLVS